MYHVVNNGERAGLVADVTGDAEVRKQLIVDCFYVCKIMAVLIHPIALEGCEMLENI